MRKEILATAALTVASLGMAGYGTAQQEDCFNAVVNQYGVESFEDLPTKVMDDSGCVSWANTLGSIGVLGGLIGTGGLIWRDRRRRSGVSVVVTGDPLTSSDVQVVPVSLDIRTEELISPSPLPPGREWVVESHETWETAATDEPSLPGGLMVDIIRTTLEREK